MTCCIYILNGCYFFYQIKSSLLFVDIVLFHVLIFVLQHKFTYLHDTVGQKILHSVELKTKCLLMLLGISSSKMLMKTAMIEINI